MNVLASGNTERLPALSELFCLLFQADFNRASLVEALFGGVLPQLLSNLH